MFDWPDCDDDDELDSIGSIGHIDTSRWPKVCEICRQDVGGSCQYCGTVLCKGCKGLHRCPDDP